MYSAGYLSASRVSAPAGVRKNITLQWVKPPHSYNHHHHINICIPPPPKNTTTQCKLLECKYGFRTSWWKEKHHRRILQRVKLPNVQVEYVCQQLREKHHHCKLLPVTTTASTRCKGQDQHQRKSKRDATTTCNSNHHLH